MDRANSPEISVIIHNSGIRKAWPVISYGCNRQERHIVWWELMEWVMWSRRGLEDNIKARKGWNCLVMVSNDGLLSVGWLVGWLFGWWGINLLTPNDDYSGRTATLTSKCFILYIYSTNIGTKYFKHYIYSPFFPLQNALCFIILTYLVPVLFTFYIHGVLKLKK